MNEIHDEECRCADCTQAWAEFNAWCNDTKQRWAKAEREGKVAKIHICDGDCGPLADCADVRDTSLVR